MQHATSMFSSLAIEKCSLMHSLHWTIKFRECARVLKMYLLVKK